MKSPLVLVKRTWRQSNGVVVPMPTRPPVSKTCGVADIGGSRRTWRGNWRCRATRARAPRPTSCCRRSRALPVTGRCGDQLIVGGRPPAEGVGIGGAQRIGHAGQPDTRSFDFAGALEDGAEPLGAGGEDGGGMPSAWRRAEHERVAAAVIER